MSEIAEVIRIYQGSDGEATRAFYARLEALCPEGVVLSNLFRAQKSSERAKVYRGGGYRGKAYDRKQWALDNLCTALERHGQSLGLAYGWGVDEKQPVHRHVLYVDLPTGQVSFHAGKRGAGPDYPGEWDGQAGRSVDRIIRYVARFLDDRMGRAA